MGNGYKLVFSNIDINRQLNTYLINRSTLYAISFHSPGAASTQEFCVSDLCTCHCLTEAGVYFRIQTWVYKYEKCGLCIVLGLWNHHMSSPGQAWVLHGSKSTLGPSQSFPPCNAGSKVLLRVWIPLAQLNEHSVQLDQSFHLQSTGHGRSPGHNCVSVGSPEQLLPPYCGGGLLHSLFLSCIPEPQVVLHSDHWDHTLQLPWTVQVRESYECQCFAK